MDELQHLGAEAHKSGAKYSHTGNSDNDPLLGEVIADDYQIIELIGSGGMGKVYKAEHKLIHQFVAIKILSNELTKQPQSMKRFIQEAQAASRINHPNVVAVRHFGLCKKHEVAYLAMEYLEGNSLSKCLNQEHNLNIERGLKIFIQICDGLSKAHKQGVVHRDIKPSNIILIEDANEKDIVKIIDFGIAKVRGIDGTTLLETLTNTTETIGSPHYMSPEQCSNKRVDHRSDIYSMGCLMYQTLTGEVLFNAKELTAVMMLHMTAQPSNLMISDEEQVLVHRLNEIIQKCLAKEPSMRYQTVEDLRNDLEAAKLRLEQLKLSNTNIILIAIEKLFLLISQKKRELQSLLNLSERAAKIWLLAGTLCLITVLLIAESFIFWPIHHAFGSIPATLARRIDLEPLILPHKQELFNSKAAKEKVMQFIKNNMMQLLDQGDISTCLQKAKQYFSLGEYEKAAECCQTGEEICLRDNVDSMSYFDTVIETCMIHAESCLRLKQYTPARDYATYTIGHLQKSGKDYGYESLLAYGIRAEANYKAGLVTEASKDYEEFMNRYTPVNILKHANDVQLVYTLSRAGKFFVEQNNGTEDKAIVLLKAALESWKEYTSKDSGNTTLYFDTSVVQNDLGIAEMEGKKYNLSHQYFELAKDNMVKAKSNYDTNYAKILFNNSDALWKLKSWYGALKERSDGRAIWQRFYPTITN